MLFIFFRYEIQFKSMKQIMDWLKNSFEAITLQTQLYYKSKERTL